VIGRKMGGVASFVEDSFDAVGDVVGDATDFIGDEVMDPVMTEVAEPVMNVVSKTVDAAMEDPIGTAVQVGTAIYAPQLLPLVTGAAALSRGASLDDALTASALAYAGQTAGQFVGSEVSAGLEDSIGKAGSSAAGKIAAGATSTAVRGGDIEQALTSGVIGAGTGAALNEVLPEDLDPWQKRAATTVASSAITGKNPAAALADQLITGGVNTMTGAGTPDASTFSIGDNRFKANPLQTTLPYVPRPGSNILTRPPAKASVQVAPGIASQVATDTTNQPTTGIASLQPNDTNVFGSFGGFDQNDQIT
jgi:hypothetical protein